MADKQVPGRGICACSTVNRAGPVCARILFVKILVKSLIVWFLLLAVPFQGVASATMLFCAPMQSYDPVAPPVATAVAHHDHAVMLAGQHTDHDHQLSGDHAKAPHNADHAPAAGHHDGSKCNSCAACCFGASMPPSLSVRVAIDTQHFTAVPFDTDFVPDVELTFPERPPQNSLT